MESKALQPWQGLHLIYSSERFKPCHKINASFATGLLMGKAFPPGLGDGFGKAKRGSPKYTTYSGSLGARDTRNSAFPAVLGVTGSRSQRLCSSVGFRARMRMASRNLTSNAWSGARQLLTTTLSAGTAHH